MTSKRILVVEDDLSTREAWRELITSWGFDVAVAEDGVRALNLITSYSPDIMLLDLRLPRKDGLTVLREMREGGVELRTIVISGEGEIPDAVRAIKLGAYEYLCKPVDVALLKHLLGNLVSHLSVSRENELLRRRLIRAGAFGELIGNSVAMKRVMALIEQVAPTSASVLILGESGTGKEIVARTIHSRSSRANRPYVAINCAALPDTLMESELFGHERGAFTGADRRREGCFELANSGTLLLDEIGEMKTELQAKLLRVLEEGRLRRLGATCEIATDVRVIAASNRDLETAREEGRFREDLYYRLNVFAITLPPLRERPEDLPILAERFIQDYSASAGDKQVRGIDNTCMEMLKAYHWPGNVRQLRNVIERALIVTAGPLVTADDLPLEITRPSRSGGTRFDVSLGCSLDEVERDLIERTLEFVKGNKARAAEILGVSLKTLYNRLERYRPRGQAGTE
jgi:two-component system, NtrC family, response regulator HydG